jgi:prepilin-type N-terminal cleavage/methylation domain-containing protein
MRRNQKRAFTLIEVLVSAALLCGLLTAGVMFAVHLAGFWAAQADDPVFERHVTGLDRYLRSYGSSEVMSEKLKAVSGDVVPFVTLKPDAGSPLMEGRVIPSGPVVAVLELRKDTGLGMVWLAEPAGRVGAGVPERVLLSPWVTAAAVVQYDIRNDKWESVDMAHAPGSSKCWTVLHLTVKNRGLMRDLWIPWREAAAGPDVGGKP